MMNSLKQQLKLLYGQLLAKINIPTVEGEKVYQAALRFAGVDASPRDLVSDEYACAESVSTILAALFPPFQVITGTYTLYLALRGAVEYVEVSSPLRGDLIISPTGLGGQNGILNGHVGIVGADRVVWSNNSNGGLWDTHLTLDSWDHRYRILGGYPVKFFRKII